MSLYRICPGCGSHLDHGERCDCLDLLSREGRETARITPPERAYVPPDRPLAGIAAPERAWIGKPGPKFSTQ